jgi:hypothetical protein
MSLSFACVIAPDSVSNEALSTAFATAAAGFDVDGAKLLVGALPGVRGVRVAFYKSGKKQSDFLETEHCVELFEEELPPGMALLDFAEGAGKVYSLVYSETESLDDGCRFDESGFERRYVREDGEGLVAGVVSPDAEREDPLDEDDAGKGAGGAAFLSKELGVNVLAALAQALFGADEVVPVRLAPPGREGVAAMTKALVATLRRVEGRAAPADPSGLGLPPDLAAFVELYDWADPSDPGDVYRELALGRIVGNARFLRPHEMRRPDGRVAVLALLGTGLASRGEPEPVFLGEAGLLTLGDRRATGTTLPELLRYLAIGFKRDRTAAEEELVQALMLRAQVRIA